MSEVLDALLDVLEQKKSNFSRQIEVLILVLFKTAMDALTRVIQ